MTLLIASYNILSSKLCNSTTFAPPNYDLEYLDSEYRYQKIWETLDPLISEHGIICLQEVDVDFANRFHLDFKARDYDFIYHPYGNKLNGYMGVALAISNKFEVKRIDRFRLVDGKNWPNIEDKSSYSSSFLKYVSMGWLDYTEREYTEWKKASGRNNFMITAEIEYEGKSVFISTVHLPCDFKNQFAMMTYAALAKEHLQDLAGKSPYVLAGDFNIRKESQAYRVITGDFETRLIEENFPQEDHWRPKVGQTMESAIKKVFGIEPAYTNYAINGHFKMTEAFKETIDYIFVSREINVVNGFMNCDFRDTKPYPNKVEPSDHVMIWSALEIK